MAYSYKLHPDAEDEYGESYLWYENKTEGLGDRFATAVRKRPDSIANNPYQYSRKKGAFREVLVDKTFPYLIIYTIEERSKSLVITSIFHTSRHPKNKYRK